MKNSVDKYKSTCYYGDNNKESQRQTKNYLLRDEKSWQNSNKKSEARL